MDSASASPLEIDVAPPGEYWSMTPLSSTASVESWAWIVASPAKETIATRVRVAPSSN